MINKQKLIDELNLDIKIAKACGNRFPENSSYHEGRRKQAIKILVMLDSAMFDDDGEDEL